MARLLICGFEAFPAAPRNPAAASVEALRARRWRPEGCEAAFHTLPVAWRRSAEAATAHLASARFDALLLVGVAVASEVFRVETVARNRAAGEKADHDGETWPFPTIGATGPEAVSSTAPCDAMLAAIRAQALPARLSQDAGDYLCNFTFYRVLQTADPVPVGFLHVPQARECAAEAAFDLADVILAVQACANVLAATVRHPAAL